MGHKRTSTVTILCLLVALTLAALTAIPTPTRAFEAEQFAGFPLYIDNSARIEYGFPTMADLTNDGTAELLVGNSNGVLFAIQISPEARVLWQFSISAAVNNAVQVGNGILPAQRSTPFRTAPAVADLDGNGTLEVIAAVGDILETPTHGGIVVLNLTAQGTIREVRPGWPQLARDTSNAPSGAGYLDGIASSPSIGDIDGDPELEIVYGGFDQYIYVRNPDGSLVPGWPRFARDTVWSSPALVNLDQDAALEVVIGIDAANGGYVLGLDNDASDLWEPWYQDEIVVSSPAVGDIDNDGLPEIVFGSGRFFATQQPNVGRYITALNHDGTLLWKTTQNIGDVLSGAPALGNVDGDAGLEVVIGGRSTSEVLVFNGATGEMLWKQGIQSRFGNTNSLFSPVLGDYNGDGFEDVFINIEAEVAVVDVHNRQQITARTINPPDQPSYYTGYSLLNAPALADVDDNGTLELIAAGGSRPDVGQRAGINVWSLPASDASVSSWPMFQRDALNTGLLFAAPEPPAEPSDVMAAAAAAESITLTWSYGGDAVDGFRIYRNTVNAEILVDTVDAATRTYTSASLQCGRTYTYRITAFRDSLETEGVTVQGSTADCVPLDPAEVVAVVYLPYAVR
ncbi:MAG: hypothetical protein HC914_01775 [Chloroflexaceae bacterium]|nr:hypothetical protein [Chloroflexaceae bacterium]